MGESARSLKSERALLLTAALAAMLLPLNSTMIAVAIPDMARDFGGDAGSATWLVGGYLIVMASLQPLAGKLGDRFGRRPLILGGLAWFAAASLGAALAPSLPVLVAFRLLQAMAGALVFPNALAVVREVLPRERRGAAFGTLGSAIGARSFSSTCRGSGAPCCSPCKRFPPALAGSGAGASTASVSSLSPGCWPAWPGS